MGKVCERDCARLPSRRSKTVGVPPAAITATRRRTIARQCR